jgi:hypothetical protein
MPTSAQNGSGNSVPEKKSTNQGPLDQERSRPSRARRAVLTGGALSLAAVAGSTLGRTQSASAATATFGPWTEVTPTEDKSGAKDVAAINSAFSSLPSFEDTDTGQDYNVGAVVLAPGDYYINAQLTKPSKADLIGSGPGTVINVVGDSNITAIYSHHSESHLTGLTQHQTKSGTIANLTVDGTGAGDDAIGIDIGDGWGHRIDHVWINNFTGTSAIGLSVCNRYFWTEKFQARHVTLVNNTTAVQHYLEASSTTTPDQSHEYQDVEYYIWAQPGQNGIVVQGVHWNGSMRVRGNFQRGDSGNAVVTLRQDPNGAGAAEMHGSFDISVEMNGTGTNPLSINFPDTMAPLSGPFSGTGFLRFDGGGQTNATPGMLQFRGMVLEANNTIQAVFAPAGTAPPAGPASGTIYTNNGHDAMVYVTAGSGGTVSQIQVGPSGFLATTGLTLASGQTVGVLVPAGYTIKITWATVQATWVWTSLL